MAGERALNVLVIGELTNLILMIGGLRWVHNTSLTRTCYSC